MTEHHPAFSSGRFASRASAIRRMRGPAQSELRNSSSLAFDTSHRSTSSSTACRRVAHLCGAGSTRRRRQGTAACSHQEEQGTHICSNFEQLSVLPRWIFVDLPRGSELAVM